MHNSLILLIVLLSGCSFHWKDKQSVFQYRGFLWYSVIQTDRVQFYEMQTFGLQFRFHPEDNGISLGYRKYIALQPPLKRQADKTVNSSGFFMSTDTFSNDAALLFKKQYGLEVGAGLLINGVSLGYDQTVIIEDSTNDISMIKKIDFYEDDPFSTSVFQSTKSYLP